MLRAKSPFKKKSPKIEQGEEMPAPARPLLHHYSSVQEFHEFPNPFQVSLPDNIPSVEDRHPFTRTSLVDVTQNSMSEQSEIS